MKRLPSLIAASLFALGSAVYGQGMAVTPTLTKTPGSPVGVGSDFALNAVAGFDFNDDDREDVVTLAYAGSGAEVRVNLGNGSGGFITGGPALSITSATVFSTEDNLAVGYLYPSEALGGTPTPSVAAVVGGRLHLYKSGVSQLGSLTEQTAPTFVDAALRGVALADLNNDGRDDIVTTGSILGNGAVFVTLNSAEGLGTPVELSSPGDSAGKLAVGDFNGDGLADIVVCNSAEGVAKIYLATAAGIYANAPVTINPAHGNFNQVRPLAVAAGDLLPATPGKELAFWNTVGYEGNNERQIQISIVRHTGGSIFEVDGSVGFSEHSAVLPISGDIALGDFNGDGQLDIVATDPVRLDGGLVIVPVGLQNGHFATHLSPMSQKLTSSAPDNVAVANLNGDVFPTGNRPKLDAIITTFGDAPNRSLDIFLNASGSATVPAGTPTITTTEWPGTGGAIVATGAANPLVFTAYNTTGVKLTTLPTGQTMSSAGVVTGIAANGTYSFKVRVAKGTKFSEKTFSFTVAHSAPLTKGAISWWPGEDAGADVLGGLAAMAPGEPTFGNAKVGRSFVFDGADDYYTAENSGDALNLRGNLTIEGWVCLNPAGKGVRTIVSKQDAADKDLTFSLAISAANKLTFSTQRKDDRAPVLATSTKVVPLNTWTHVAATVRGAYVSLYIDGRAVASLTLPKDYLAPSTSGQDVLIGASRTPVTGAKTAFFSGQVDELTIYRRALEAEEVELIARVGDAGKVRADASRDFSTAVPPQSTTGGWMYGSHPYATFAASNFVPFEILNILDPALDVWKSNTPNHAQVSRNRLGTTHSIGAGTSEIRYAPKQVAQKRGGDSSYSVVRWKATQAGRYAVSATWKNIDAHQVAAGHRIYHNNTELAYANAGLTFLGNGVSRTLVITAEAGDTVDFLTVENFADPNDTSSLFASVVPLPEEFVPVVTPEDFELTYDLPLQNGKEWKFRVRQGDSRQHEGRISVSLQFAFNDNPNNWVSIPLSDFKLTSTVGWQLITNSVPEGAGRFRVAVSVAGEETVYGAPSELLTIAAPSTILKFESREQLVASDPEGGINTATTHRGDTITYKFVVRNAGGLPGSNVFLRASIPAGTQLVSKLPAAGKLMVKPAPFPGFPSISYIVWNLGNFAPLPASKALTFELKVKVIDPTVASDSLNQVGTKIKQADYALCTGTFQSPGQIVSGPFPWMEATIVDPITVTAIADDLTPDQGGFVNFTITTTNNASYTARAVQVQAATPAGMFLPIRDPQNADAQITFLDSNNQPSGAPIDPATKKQARFAKGLNPQRNDTIRPDGKMLASFYIGSMLPGATQKVRVRAQVQYGYFGRADAFAADATIRAENLAAIWTTTAARVMEVKAAPINLDVNVVPSAPRPQLGFNMAQAGADEIGIADDEGKVIDRVMGVTNKPSPIVGTLPVRYTNQLHFGAVVYNVGNRDAEFTTVHLPVPEGTDYLLGSMKVNGAAVVPVRGEVGGVRVVSVNLPTVAKNGGIVKLKYAVYVLATTPEETNIENTGGLITSRDMWLSPLGFIFAPAKLPAKVVANGQIVFDVLGEEVKAGATEVNSFILYQNTGGLNATNVKAEFTIPEGLLFKSAQYIDLGIMDASITSATNRKPTNFPVGQRGTITFDLGTVPPAKMLGSKLKPGASVIKITCTVDAANITATTSSDPNFGTPDDAFKLKHPVTMYKQTAGTASGFSLLAVNKKEQTSKLLEIKTNFARVGAVGATPQPLARTFVSMMAPATVPKVDGQHVIQYTVMWGNVSNITGGVGGLRVPIPEGTEYIAGSVTNGVSSTGNALNNADAHYNGPGEVNGLPENGSITWITNSAPHSVTIATFKVRVKPDHTGPVVAQGGRLGLDQSGVRKLRAITTTLREAGVPPELAQSTAYSNALDETADAALTNADYGTKFVAEAQKITDSSLTATIDGVDFMKSEITGNFVIPLGGNQLVAAGGGNLIGNDGSTLIGNDGSTLVAAGGGNLVAAGGMNLVQVDMGAGLMTGNALYAEIPQLVAAGGMNLVNAGGLNLLNKSTLSGLSAASLVGNDGASLIGNDGSTLGVFRLIGNDGSTFIPSTGGNIALPNSGTNLVAAGGGNLVAAGGGNLVAAGGMNLVQVGGVPLVAAGGGNLIGIDGSTLVAAGGGNLVGNDGSTLVAAGGGNLGAQTAGRLVAAGGGNIVSGSNGL